MPIKMSPIQGLTTASVPTPIKTGLSWQREKQGTLSLSKKLQPVTCKLTGEDHYKDVLEIAKRYGIEDKV